MFIEIEDTPNPNTTKFIITENILKDNKTYYYPSQDHAVNSPLGLKLFELEEVSSVFLGTNFLSISVHDSNTWEYVKPQIVVIITNFLNTGLSIVNTPSILNIDESGLSDDILANKTDAEKDIIVKIQDLLERNIRPAVAMDGGDIIFRDYIDGVLYIEMQGACSGCPSSSVTLRNGVENMLKHYVPEVKEVVNIE